MKNPWLVFTGICAVVIGIVVICVVFGGYSSLLRSKNRISQAKQMLIAQCNDQVTLAGRLANCTGKGGSDSLCRRLKRLESILVQINGSEEVMDAELIQAFETAERDLVKDTNAFQEKSQSTQAETQKMQDTFQAVFVMIRQYNKEARYFNNHSKTFPTLISAKLFGLDQIKYQEIALEMPPKERGEASAS